MSGGGRPTGPELEIKIACLSTNRHGPDENFAGFKSFETDSRCYDSSWQTSQQSSGLTRRGIRSRVARKSVLAATTVMPRDFPSAFVACLTIRLRTALT